MLVGSMWLKKELENNEAAVSLGLDYRNLKNLTHFKAFWNQTPHGSEGLWGHL